MKIKFSYSGAAFAAILLLAVPCRATHKLPDSHIKGWVLSGTNPSDYQSGIDKNIKYSGVASAFLCSTKKASYGKAASLMQIIKSDSYRGKRIRVSAWIKTGNLKGVAGLWLETNRIENSELPGGGARLIKGNMDWKEYSLVVDVDTDSPFVELGVILSDTGKVWIDEVKVETVSKDVPLSISYYKKMEASSNLSFENISPASNTPDFWFGDNGIDYELTSDHAVFHDGAASACLKSISTIGKSKFGDIYGRMMPDSFAGKRVRMTGWIKTENINKWAGMWMRVDGPNYGEILSSDNMQKRAIKGTTDWTKYEIVLDVPKLATAIYFGALFEGEGKLWLDDVKFEVVGNDVPITSTYAHKGKKYKDHNKQRLQYINPSLVNSDFEG